MGLVSLSAVLGLLVGFAFGGRLAALERVTLHGWPLLVTAVLAQVLGVALGHLGVPAGGAYAGGLACSAACVAVFLAVNRAVAGTGLLALGLGVNALVIAVNGAMPVSAYAAVRAGVGAAAVADARHVPATDGTHLRLLADVIPVPLPGRPEVDSVGDLLAAAGLAQLACTATEPRRRRRGRRERARTRGWVPRPSRWR